MSVSLTSTTRTCRVIPRRSRRHSSGLPASSSPVRLWSKTAKSLSRGHKKTVWVNVNMPENLQVKRDITQSFTKDYTVSLVNYPVRDYLAPHPFVHGMLMWRPEVRSWQPLR